MRCERDDRRGEASLESIFVPPLHRCGAELVCLCDVVSMAGLCRRGSRKMVMSDALGTRALAACARNCPPQFRHRQRRGSPASPGWARPSEAAGRGERPAASLGRAFQGNLGQAELGEHERARAARSALLTRNWTSWTCCLALAKRGRSEVQSRQQP